MGVGRSPATAFGVSRSGRGGIINKRLRRPASPTRASTASGTAAPGPHPAKLTSSRGTCGARTCCARTRFVDVRCCRDATRPCWMRAHICVLTRLCTAFCGENGLAGQRQAASTGPAPQTSFGGDGTKHGVGVGHFAAPRPRPAATGSTSTPSGTCGPARSSAGPLTTTETAARWPRKLMTVTACGREHVSPGIS